MSRHDQRLPKRFYRSQCELPNLWFRLRRLRCRGFVKARRLLHHSHVHADDPWYLDPVLDRTRVEDPFNGVVALDYVRKDLPPAYEARSEVLKRLASSLDGKAVVDFYEAARLNPVLVALRQAGQFAQLERTSTVGDLARHLRLFHEIGDERTVFGPASRRITAALTVSAELSVHPFEQADLDKLNLIERHITRQLNMRALFEDRTEEWTVPLREMGRPSEGHRHEVRDDVLSTLTDRTLEEIQVLREFMGFDDPSIPLPARSTRQSHWAVELQTDLADRVRLLSTVAWVEPPSLYSGRCLE